VSGCGVGKDVVKTSVDRVGGTIEVESKAGEGTTVRMKIPAALAILDFVQDTFDRRVDCSPETS
jgi:two-component system chemotaxis sensor kinase CheA